MPQWTAASDRTPSIQGVLLYFCVAILMALLSVNIGCQTDTIDDDDLYDDGGVSLDGGMVDEVPESMDHDGDGIIAELDPDDNDPCTPNRLDPACNERTDSDGDGVFDDIDPVADDPCIPDSEHPQCVPERSDRDGDGVYEDIDPNDADPCIPDADSSLCHEETTLTSGPYVGEIETGIRCGSVGNRQTCDKESICCMTAAVGFDRSVTLEGHCAIEDACTGQLDYTFTCDDDSDCGAQQECCASFDPLAGTLPTASTECVELGSCVVPSQTTCVNDASCGVGAVCCAPNSEGFGVELPLDLGICIVGDRCES